MQLQNLKMRSVVNGLSIFVSLFIFSNTFAQAEVSNNLKYCDLIRFSHYKNLCYKMVQEEGIPEYAIARSLLFIEDNENNAITVDHKERTQDKTEMVKRDVVVRSQFVAIVDFNKPSTEKRLHIINTGTFEHVKSYVTHGKNTGGLKPEGKNSFSNEDNSNKSAVGLYLTGPFYYGSNGKSLNLYGLDTTNSNVSMRDIVIHKADYATDDFIKAHGMLGRSLGCPAVPPEIMKNEVLVKLGEGAVVYLHYNGIEPVKLPSANHNNAPYFE